MDDKAIRAPIYQARYEDLKTALSRWDGEIQKLENAATHLDAARKTRGRIQHELDDLKRLAATDGVNLEGN